MKLALFAVAALALVYSSLAMSLNQFSDHEGNEKKNAKFPGKIIIIAISVYSMLPIVKTSIS